MAKRIKDLLNRKTLTPEQIAKKHNVSLSMIKKQLGMGDKVEREHTKSAKVADEIARDHLGEIPNYYSKLTKAHLEESIDWDYVFGYLIESEDEPEWKITPYKHVTEYEHKFSVPNKTPGGPDVPVHVSIIHHKEKGVHDTAFSVGGEINAREGVRRLSPQGRMAVMRGVAKAVEHHAVNHVQPGERIEATTSEKDFEPVGDERRSLEDKKTSAQSIFFYRLAKKTGMKYKPPSWQSLQPQHTLTKPAA